MSRSSKLVVAGVALTLGGAALVTLTMCTPATTGPHSTLPDSRIPEVISEVTRPDLVRFASARDFQRYIEKIDAVQRAQQVRYRRSTLAGEPGVLAEATTAAPEESADAEGDGDSGGESITNNQEQGVDEGGIVKVHGDHLVVLRRGGIFTVRLPDRTPVDMIDAFPSGASSDAWYDEMLVHDDTIVVVGYSYGASATEIGLFDIDAAGGLSHRDTWYLRSNDYYSSRNYASRLVGDELIFYMPYHLSWRRTGDDEPLLASLPSIAHHDGDAVGDDDWNEVVTASNIFQPIQPTANPVLHTVVRCDLTAARTTCTAQSIIGPYSRNFYVAPTAVYVWVAGGFDPWGGVPPEDLEPEPEPETNAVVYRLPLDGRTDPGALRVWGSPTDQFSFKESDREYLNVLVRAVGGGDAMWAPEVTDGDVALLRVPLSDISADVRVADASRYTDLPRPLRGYAFQNRFVGDYVLYGTGNSWGWYDDQHDPRVFLHPFRRGGRTTTLDLPHGVDRIEAMGRAAVVVGSDRRDLHFSAVSLGVQPALAGRHTQRGATQGETRSHGFFYKPSSETEGVLGLPVRAQGRPGWSHLVEGSASVLYLSVNDLAFTRLGALGARDANTNDRCVASCVDWYGNARPIFLRGRVFALLGYELVEGRVEPGAITEVGRTNFYRQQPRRASL